MSLALFTVVVHVLFGAFSLFARSSPTPPLLQPLPKHFKPGNATVVFIKDRLPILPKGFTHTEDGIDPHFII
jgi:hypothetical protein